MTATRVFDGHNDVLSKLHASRPEDPADAFIDGYDAAIDLPKSVEGGFAGGFFAVYVPPLEVDHEARLAAMTAESYALPLPPELEQSYAAEVVNAQIGILQQLEERQALQNLPFNRRNSRVYDRRHRQPRSCTWKAPTPLTLIWPSSTVFMTLACVLSDRSGAGGRPSSDMACPSPSRQARIPAGLTDAGRRLVKRCDDLGILIDLSHMNEAGFWDVAKLSAAPLIATHSNAHAVCQHARNLTDDQLRAIADSGGMVGLNFATAFLRPDGKMLPEVPFEVMMRHLDHMLGILGEDHVGLGSDYDGAVVPEQLRTAADLPGLVEALRSHGFGGALVEKLCIGNWLRALDRVWH